MLQLVVAGLTVGSGYALIALGIHLTLRATRVVNFAQGEFSVLGGLIALSIVSVFGVSTWIALAGATFAGFFLGVLFERIVVRPTARWGEINVTIATVGTIFVLLYGHALVPGWGSDPQPLPALGGSASAVVEAGGLTIGVPSLYVIGLLFAALAVLYVFFERTYYGKAIRAAANDPIGARLVGIDVRSTQAMSVGLSIALAAYGGTILGPITLVGGAGGTALAIKGFVAAIVGGIESPVGCVAGGLLVGVVEKLIQGLPNVSAGIADPIVYALLILGLAVRPQGLFGTRAPVRD
jgi:branched-chain amino acid transport system permease protein